MATTQQAAMQPPPRLTGDYAADAQIIREWMQMFYSIGVLQTGLIDPSFQSNPGNAIDPDNLPDPTQTTIARSQATANSALTQARAAAAGLPGLTERVDTAEADIQALETDIVTVNNRAVQAQADADAALAGLPFLIVPFTLADLDNSATITFATPLPDTNYLVLVGNQGFTGTPPLEALVLASVATTTANFTLTFGAAPGSGNSVSYTAILFPT